MSRLYKKMATNFVTEIPFRVFRLFTNSLSCSELITYYAKNHLGFMFVGLHGLSGNDIRMGPKVNCREEL